ncbi:MAG: 50S ribosomal protein L15 [Parachlamydiales bacterium]|jgi:large subunit ribosomal protein L15
MIELSKLTNSTLVRKNIQRVGRGPGSGRGKTASRGQKGAKSRSGYKRRYGYEGGQMRLFRKLPCRGFTRGRHVKPMFILNLDQIEQHFEAKEEVSLEALKAKGLVPSYVTGGLKILSQGELKKKVKKIIASKISGAAREKLEKMQIEIELVSHKVSSKA